MSEFEESLPIKEIRDHAKNLEAQLKEAQAQAQAFQAQAQAEADKATALEREKMSEIERLRAEREDALKKVQELTPLQAETEKYRQHLQNQYANELASVPEEHIQKWGWRVQNGRVNYPDYQTRIYRNNSEIKWRNKVHEVIEGYKQYTALPEVDALSLIHPKTIERQERQNAYYDTL